MTAIQIQFDQDTEQQIPIKYNVMVKCQSCGGPAKDTIFGEQCGGCGVETVYPFRKVAMYAGMLKAEMSAYLEDDGETVEIWTSVGGEVPLRCRLPIGPAIHRGQQWIDARKRDGFIMSEHPIDDE